MFDETTSLINLYGPTEAAVDVTYWNCTKMDIDKKIPIGYPIDNTQIYIVDENNVRVPNGIMGEIVISGIQLARGYINRDELTKIDLETYLLMEWVRYVYIRLVI